MRVLFLQLSSAASLFMPCSFAHKACSASNAYPCQGSQPLISSYVLFAGILHLSSSCIILWGKMLTAMRTFSSHKQISFLRSCNLYI